MAAGTLIRCDRCKRRLRNPHSPQGQQWNATVINGRVVGHLCPDCQTPDEAEEAVHNLATNDYRTGTDARVVDTAALAEAAEYANARCDAGEWAFALHAEAIETLDPEGHHICIAVTWDEDSMLVAVIFNAEADDGDVVSDQEALAMAWLQVRPTDWMSWEQTVLKGDWQQTISDQAKRMLAEVERGDS